MKPQDYNYHLPQSLIANEPVEPRDSARLFVYSTKTNEIILDSFAHLAMYIPANSLLVLNDTQVVPARLELMKLTGGSVSILFLINEWDKKSNINGLPDKKLTIGDILYFKHRAVFEVIDQHDEEFTFKILISVLEFEKLFHTDGQTTLPPHIHSNLSEEDARVKYQTIFATKPASVAAPMASLHFTDQVFWSLALKGIDRTSVTLHVGRGIFSPLKAENILEKKLHSEPIQVSQESAQKIMEAKQKGKIIVSSGTTATRTLESTAENILQGKGYSGETSLMITPPYNFKIVDAMITNFHLPNTSLIMLVDAFLQSKGAKSSWIDLYERAIHEKFRFHSFGDVMLII